MGQRKNRKRGSRERSNSCFEEFSYKESKINKKIDKELEVEKRFIYFLIS